MFVQLMRKFYVAGMYKTGTPVLNKCIKHFKAMVAHLFPDLNEHFVCHSHNNTCSFFLSDLAFPIWRGTGARRHHSGDLRQPMVLDTVFTQFPSQLRTSDMGPILL